MSCSANEVTCLFALTAVPEIISAHSYWKNFVDGWKLSLIATAEIKGILACEFDTAPEWDLCGPAANDEDFGDYIAPTISCNILKTAFSSYFSHAASGEFA